MLRVHQSQKAGTPQIPITCAPSARGKSAQPQTGTEALVRATTRVNPEDAVPVTADGHEGHALQDPSQESVDEANLQTGA